MKKAFLATILAALATGSASALPPPPPDAAWDAYKKDEIAWSITEGLSTEIGPRLAGTDAEARARIWAMKKLKALGLKNVREESFAMPTWIRGKEEAEVISFFPQKLVVTALGNSASTGETGIEGDVRYFRSFDDLKSASDGSVKGKIVFIDHDMQKSQDGSHYGHFGPARFIGPNIAAKKGAIAFVVRSLGTDSHRLPHAGNTSFEDGVVPIPSAALSNPDADNLIRMIRRAPADGFSARPIRIRLTLTPKNIGQQKSGNVIAEIPGSDPSLPLILVACHLDSWDLGTGAIDDASGCGIVTSAAIHAAKYKQPLRTIRILWAGAEEVGVWGGRAYAQKNSNVPHALAMESDFGADRVWRAEYTLNEATKPMQERINRSLIPFGIASSQIKARGGADIRPVIIAQKLAVIDLQQDGTDYFDLHHTADDTLDKIDKAKLRQNVAAWTVVLREIANYNGRLKP